METNASYVVHAYTEFLQVIVELLLLVMELVLIPPEKLLLDWLRSSLAPDAFAHYTHEYLRQDGGAYPHIRNQFLHPHLRHLILDHQAFHCVIVIMNKG